MPGWPNDPLAPLLPSNMTDFLRDPINNTMKWWLSVLPPELIVGGFELVTFAAVYWHTKSAAAAGAAITLLSLALFVIPELQRLALAGVLLGLASIIVSVAKKL